MAETKTKQVQFTRENIDMCRCGSCPVQARSTCAMGKMANRTQENPQPKDVPLEYCSQGQASCEDLDFTPNCICPTCEVWQSNGLESYKYCQNGGADRIG